MMQSVKHFGITISIHALLAESDSGRIRRFSTPADFYPRSPCGERPRRTYQQGEKLTFLSTLSLRRATQYACKGILCNQFLSTLSLRRATILFGGALLCIVYFYPRSPCGERLPLKSESLTTYFISIHALLAESDFGFCDLEPIWNTISIHALLAESDQLNKKNPCKILISIHALLAESDAVGSKALN